MSAYFGYIAGSYGATALALIGLAAAILRDDRRQRRQLAALEAQGVRRRSARGGQAE
jgi:heme exporter protein D